MERIQGLKEYVQTEHYLEGIGILVRTPTDRKETGASCQYRKPDASEKSD